MLFTIPLFGCVNTQNEVEETKVERIQWSKEWFTTSNNRLKGAVTIDSQGTMVIVGQKFTTTDSMEYPSMIAKVSPEGELLISKPIGNSIMEISKYKRRERFYERNEERLTQILKTNDSRLLLFGYKTFENHEDRLWIIEIDKDLNVLKDTVYMNLVTSDTRKIKAFSTKNGWYIITGNYWETNGLSRYGVPIFEFDSDFKCINSIKSLTVPVGDSILRISNMNNAVEYDNELLICGDGGFTHNKLDEDDIVNFPYIFRFNKKNRQSQILKKYPIGYSPISIKKSRNQYVALLEIKEKNISHQFVISYDSSMNEIWRYEQQLGVKTCPSILTYKNNLWYTCGRYRSVDGNGNYVIAYNSKGEIVSKVTYAHKARNPLNAYNPTGGSVAIEFDEIVDEIKINENQFYRLYIEDGLYTSWTIDKFEFN